MNPPINDIHDYCYHIIIMARLYGKIDGRNVPTFLCSLHVATALTEEITENSQTPQTSQSKHLTRYCSYSLTISNLLSHLYHQNT